VSLCDYDSQQSRLNLPVASSPETADSPCSADTANTGRRWPIIHRNNNSSTTGTGAADGAGTLPRSGTGPGAEDVSANEDVGFLPTFAGKDSSHRHTLPPKQAGYRPIPRLCIYEEPSTHQTTTILSYKLRAGPTQAPQGLQRTEPSKARAPHLALGRPPPAWPSRAPPRPKAPGPEAAAGWQTPRDTLGCWSGPRGPGAAPCDP
jgi:hypothetical protein